MNPGVTLRLIEPRKPTQNAYIESLDGRFRDECLTEHWFTSLAHAQVGLIRFSGRVSYVSLRSSSSSLAGTVRIAPGPSR